MFTKTPVWEFFVISLQAYSKQINVYVFGIDILYPESKL